MKNLISICFILFFSKILAQEVAVSSSAEQSNMHINSNWTSVLGQDETGYYLLRESGDISNKVIILEKYDPSLTPIFSTNIEATSGIWNNGKYHEFTEFANGKVYIFLKGWNKEQQQSSFYVQEVLQDGRLSEDMALLETDPATSLSKSVFYKIKFSPDGSKLLVLTEKPYIKDSKENIRLQVFNSTDFSSIWSRDLTLGNADKGASNEILIDNGGNAYIFKDIRISRKEHQYQLLSIGKEHKEATQIDLKGYAPVQKRMIIDPSGKLLIVGMLGPYEQDDTDWQAIWYFEADHFGKIVHNNISPLGEALLSEFVSGNSARKENYVLEDFVLKDVILKPSGGALLLTEFQQQTIQHLSGTGNKILTEEYTLNYGPALVISLDEKGDREWISILDKSQKDVTSDPKVSYGSFAYHLKDEKLYLIWNYTDWKRNPPPFATYRFWHDINGNKINIDNLFGNLALHPTLLTVIDRDGNFVYDKRTFKSLPLLDIQKPNSFLMAVNPRIFFQTKDGIIILSHMPKPDIKRFKFNSISY